MICDLRDISNKIKEEGMDLLVVSYGGSASNTFTQHLEKNNYKITTPTWHQILCHCPHYIDIPIPMIYVYDNPIKSFLSMKRRGSGYWDLNQQKLSNCTDIELSDDNLMKLMKQQFESWTIPRENVLVVQSCELFEPPIVEKLEKFLKTTIHHFPIAYTTPNTNLQDVEEYRALLDTPT
jgi:hypothetical protein